MKFILCAIVILMSLQDAVTFTIELPAVPADLKLPNNLVLPKPPMPPRVKPGFESKASNTPIGPESEDFTYNLGYGQNIIFEGLSKYGINFKVRDPPGRTNDNGDTSAYTTPPDNEPTTPATSSPASTPSE